MPIKLSYITLLIVTIYWHDASNATKPKLMLPQPPPLSKTGKVIAKTHNEVDCDKLCDNGQGGALCNCGQPPAANRPTKNEEICHSLCSLGVMSLVCECDRLGIQPREWHGNVNGKIMGPYPIEKDKGEDALRHKPQIEKKIEWNSGPPRAPEPPLGAKPNRDVDCDRLCDIGKGGALCNCGQPPSFNEE